LKIDRKIRCRAIANFRQGGGLFLVVNRDANHVSPRVIEQIDQFGRAVDILSRCGRHALDGDRMPDADSDRANFDGACGISIDFGHGTAPSQALVGRKSESGKQANKLASDLSSIHNNTLLYIHAIYIGLFYNYIQVYTLMVKDKFNLVRNCVINFS